jgi:3-keto-5-aminohexanoate cleavage enzyme
LALSRAVVLGSTKGKTIEKVIINAALTGMIAMKADNPSVPILVDEIVSDAIRCYAAGASIVHVHARQSDGVPTHDGAVFQEIYAEIRSSCPDLLISGTTSGRFVDSVDLRSEALGEGHEIRPDFASLTLGSMNFRTSASVNAPETIKTLANKMNALGIVPELEVFNTSMAEYAVYLQEKAVLKKPLYCNILLGSVGTLAATPRNLLSVIDALPADCTWSATGIGRAQFKTNLLAVAMGGHVRVGLEDNLWMDDAREDLATNARMVERIANVALASGRGLATPAEALDLIHSKSDRKQEGPAKQ